MAVGEPEGKTVGVACCGDFVAGEGDAAWVEDFVIKVACFVGHLLESAVEGERMVVGDGGEIESSVSPPLRSETDVSGDGVGVAHGEVLSPARIDFLFGGARLVVEVYPVFHQLVVTF